MQTEVTEAATDAQVTFNGGTDPHCSPPVAHRQPEPVGAILTATNASDLAFSILCQLTEVVCQRQERCTFGAVMGGGHAPDRSIAPHCWHQRTR